MDIYAPLTAGEQRAERRSKLWVVGCTVALMGGYIYNGMYAGKTQSRDIISQEFHAPEYMVAVQEVFRRLDKDNNHQVEQKELGEFKGKGLFPEKTFSESELEVFLKERRITHSMLHLFLDVSRE